MKDESILVRCGMVGGKFVSHDVRAKTFSLVSLFGGWVFSPGFVGREVKCLSGSQLSEEGSLKLT